MKSAALFAGGVVCGMIAIAALVPGVAGHVHSAAWHVLHGGHAEGSATRAHTEESFTFTANAPLAEVMPLFGAEKEKAWAPEWNPKFIYPATGGDARGMVFTVEHGHRKSVWVNSEFDMENGRVQYVYVIPEVVVTVITLSATAEVEKTRVEVKYERTALSAEADEHVRRMAEGDRGSGAEWEKQMNGYLAGKK